MPIRSLLTTVLLFVSSASFAQPGSEAGGAFRPDPYGSDKVQFLGDLEVHMSRPGESIYFLDAFGSQQIPRYRILKGMGLRVRQIADTFVYKHLPLADHTGMVVEDILANLPADKAGIRVGDIVAKVDGKSISSVDAFVKTYKACPSDRVKVEILQKGRLKTVEIDKSDVAKWEKEYRMGVHVEPIPDALAKHLGWDAKSKQGLYISSIVKDSPSEKAGLKGGDLLLKANGKPLKSTDVLNQLVRESQGKEMTFDYMRAGGVRQLKLTPAEQPDPNYRLSDVQIDLTPHPRVYPVINQSVDQKSLKKLIEAVEKLSKDVAELRKEIQK